MKTFRVLTLAAAAILIAACASTPKAPAAPAAPPPPAVTNLAGNWTVTIDSQMGSQDSKMVLTQTGADLKGSLESPMGTVPLTGNIADKAVNFSFNINAQGMDLKIDFIGTIESPEALKGRAVFGTFGEGTFTAKKTP